MKTTTPNSNQINGGIYTKEKENLFPPGLALLQLESVEVLPMTSVGATLSKLPFFSSRPIVFLSAP